MCLTQPEAIHRYKYNGHRISCQAISSGIVWSKQNKIIPNEDESTQSKYLQLRLHLEEGDDIGLITIPNGYSIPHPRMASYWI